MNLQKEFTRIFGSAIKATVKTAALPGKVLPVEPLVTRDEMIKLLNEDLILEYTSALQYFQHYARMEGSGFGSIREEINKHGMEEIEHASKLADRIAYMGGVPAVGTTHIKLAPTSEEMLVQDLVDETTAVKRYKERVMQALSMGEFGLADILQDILVDEEEHKGDLEGVLNREGNSASPEYTKL